METFRSSAQVQKSAVWEADSIDCVNYTISKYAYLIDYIGILAFCA